MKLEQQNNNDKQIKLGIKFCLFTLKANSVANTNYDSANTRAQAKHSSKVLNFV